MKKMFISGSMSTDLISDDVIRSINNSIEREYQILVGDAKGIDKNIQDLLKLNNYKNVVIYHIGKQPRNISDTDWKVKCVEVDKTNSKMFRNGRYTREAQMQKDLSMAIDSDFGLVIWEDIKKNRFGNLQVSKGSLNNIFNLLLLKKPVGVYLQAHSDNGIKTFNKFKEFESNIMNELVHEKTLEYYLELKKNFIKEQNLNKSNKTKEIEQISLF